MKVHNVKSIKVKNVKVKRKTFKSVKVNIEKV